jgi:hypothetical protein
MLLKKSPVRRVKLPMGAFDGQVWPQLARRCPIGSGGGTTFDQRLTPAYSSTEQN